MVKALARTFLLLATLGISHPNEVAALIEEAAQNARQAK
jgi:isopropylmalate/homocitrate/citramalate synthase